MPEEIGPGDPLDPESQQKLNAALKVNMFTPFNVSSLNKAQKKVAFFDKLAVAFAEYPLRGCPAPARPSRTTPEQLYIHFSKVS